MNGQIKEEASRHYDLEPGAGGTKAEADPPERAYSLGRRLLQSYVPLGDQRVDFIQLNLWLTASWIVLLLLASYRDSTLRLPSFNTGLLEDPAIIRDLALQALLPFSLLSAANRLLSIRYWGRESLSPKFIEDWLVTHEAQLERTAKRTTVASRAIYGFLVAIGASMFVWNLYSAQQPRLFYGNDIWDSLDYSWGFYLSRVYRAYTYLIFFPAILHAQIVILTFTGKLVSSAQREDSITLDPFHQDGHGGLRRFMEVALSPTQPLLILSGVSALSLVLIQGRLDMVMGVYLISTFVFCVLLYLIMALPIRNAIKAEKERQLFLISKRQATLYFDLLGKKENSLSPKEVDEQVSSLANLSKAVHSLPSWPLRRYVVRASAWTGLSSVASPFLEILWPKIAQRLTDFMGL